jgi:hypothetical protein
MTIIIKIVELLESQMKIKILNLNMDWLIERIRIFKNAGLTIKKMHGI